MNTEWNLLVNYTMMSSIQWVGFGGFLLLLSLVCFGHAEIYGTKRDETTNPHHKETYSNFRVGFLLLFSGLLFAGVLFITSNIAGVFFPEAVRMNEECQRDYYGKIHSPFCKPEGLKNGN